MPRLYDMMLQAPGTLIDKLFCGAYRDIAYTLRRAECFELAPDIVMACDSVSKSKPSSILSALPKARVPYELMWMEWVPNDRQQIQNSKPVPRRMGCLLISEPQGDKGAAIFAWAHSDQLVDMTLNPISIVFDWSNEGTPLVDLIKEKHHIAFEKFNKMPDTREFFSKQLARDPNWRKFAGDEKEIDSFISMEKRAIYLPNNFCMKFISQNRDMMLPPTGDMYRMFESDLVGELPFITAFLLLLNTRNTIVDQKKDDFGKLNKARAKVRKPPLKEFTTTHLKLNRVQHNRGVSITGSREAARAHLVRGHFKLRSSGAYWWSPHVRGAEDPMRRHGYKVHL